MKFLLVGIDLVFIEDLHFLVLLGSGNQGFLLVLELLVSIIEGIQKLSSLFLQESYLLLQLMIDSLFLMDFLLNLGLFSCQI